MADLKINGNDVMTMKNLTPGPLVGKYLEMIFAEVVEKGIPNQREILIKKLEGMTI